jgi:hypothetical protein
MLSLLSVFACNSTWVSMYWLQFPYIQFLLQHLIYHMPIMAVIIFVFSLTNYCGLSFTRLLAPQLRYGVGGVVSDVDIGHSIGGNVCAPKFSETVLSPVILVNN